MPEYCEPTPFLKGQFRLYGHSYTHTACLMFSYWMLCDTAAQNTALTLVNLQRLHSQHTGAAMKAIYQQLAARVCEKWQEAKANGQPRLIIALAGPPGSGKSTIAKEIVELVKKSPDGPSIKLIPADGFHFPLSMLRSLPNAEEALKRRGAHWTFDAAATVDLVRRLRNDAGRAQVLAPTFDHAVKDPVLDSLVVDIDTEVCIIEGNYVLVDEAPWSEISGLVDDRWLITVDRELARQRVASRHLKAGIEKDLHDALLRVDHNDSLNGDYVMEHSLGRQDLLVGSIEEARSDAET